MTTTTSSTAHSDPTGCPPVGAAPRLGRPRDDRMVAGVCAGLARYFDADATVVRLVFALLVLVGGAGVPLYIAGWLLIPEDGAERPVAADFVDQLSSRRTA